MTLYPFPPWALEAKGPNGDDHKTDVIQFRFQCVTDVSVQG